MADRFIEELFGSKSDMSSVNLGSESCVAEAYTRLETYGLEDHGDHAKRILSAFLEYLPDEGKLFVARAILLCNDQRLRDLCRRLEAAILLPSKAKLFIYHVAT